MKPDELHELRAHVDDASRALYADIRGPQPVAASTVRGLIAGIRKLEMDLEQLERRNIEHKDAAWGTLTHPGPPEDCPYCRECVRIKEGDHPAMKSMVKALGPGIDHQAHENRKGDRANPHRGDCTGTLCPVCGCCMHCPLIDDVCPACPGCSSTLCSCPTEEEVKQWRSTS